MRGRTRYSQKRLDAARGTACPECGPTTWISSPSGYVCCGCGHDLEALLPPLCHACGGSGFQGAGGNVIGMWTCPHCHGTGRGVDIAALLEEIRAREEAGRADAQD